MKESAREITSRGYVRFPSILDYYPSSEGNGMYVRLVVHQDKQKKWMLCDGGGTHIIYDGLWLYTPAEPEFPDVTGKKISEVEELLHEYQQKAREPARRQFPSLYIGRDNLRKGLSIPYLAVMTIGSTNGVWVHRETKDYWRCLLSDLTYEGRSIYNLLSALYPDHYIELQTWMDT